MCKTSFLHLVFTAALQQRTTINKSDIFDIGEFGCNEDGKITWLTVRKGVFITLSNIQDGLFAKIAAKSFELFSQNAPS